MRIVTIAIGLAVTTASAHAQPTEAAEPKSPTTALVLSTGGTALPIALGLAATRADSSAAASTLGLASLGAAIVGPSLGHWYAGRYFTVGMGMRLVGGVALGGGIADTLSCQEDCESALAGPLITTGIVLVAVGTLTDLVSAPRAAERWNDRHQLSLVPLAKQDTFGLAVVGGW